MNVKLNDNVKVISGSDAGKRGKVVAVSPKSGTVTVEGVNLHKKAQKARKANETSQLVEKEFPIDASNVMVVCPSCGLAVRVKHTVEGGKKVRVCGKCGAVLDKAFVGKKAAAAAEAPKKRVRKRAKKEEGGESAAPAEEKAE